MIKDCCKDNLVDPERITDDMVVRVCGVCGAKHYELTVDVADMVSEGAEA